MTCYTCGEVHAFRWREFWDWTGRVSFHFCSPACRTDAERILGVRLIERDSNGELVRSRG
jgi:hypothetical protein